MPSGSSPPTDTAPASGVRRFLDDQLLPAQDGHRRRPSAPAERVLRLGVWFAVVGVLLQTLIHLVNGIVPAEPRPQLDADSEGNLFAWMSSMATFASAFAVLVLAVLRWSERSRFLVLAGILTFFAVDDAIEIHERIQHYTGGIWPLFYLPLLAVAGLLLLHGVRDAPTAARRLLLAGLGGLVLAVAMEATQYLWLFDRYPHGSGAWQLVVNTGIEEALELGGWLLVATALTATMLDRAVAGSGSGSRSAPGAARLE